MTIKIDNISVSDFDGVVTDGTGRKVEDISGATLSLQPGWHAKSLIGIEGDAKLLILQYNDGGNAIWVLDDDLRFISDLEFIQVENSPTEIWKSLSLFCRELLKLLVFSLNNVQLNQDQIELWLFLENLRGKCLDAIFKIASLSIAKGSLNDPETCPKLWDNKFPFSSHSVDNLIRSDVSLSAVVRAGDFRLPAIAQEGWVDRIRMIDRIGNKPVYVCEEKFSKLTYILAHSPLNFVLLYIPDYNIILSDRNIDDSDITHFIQRVSVSIFMINAEMKDVNYLLELGSKPTIGLLTSGLLNFGHAIWDEMQAVDRLLSGVSATLDPILCFVNNQSGLDLYGNAEKLYPELEGRIYRGESEYAIFAFALKNNIVLVLRDGQRALLSSRLRIERLVSSSAHESAFPVSSGLIITFGIRLTNRCPINLTSFYTRLALDLKRRFGSLVVVLDGINGDGSGTPATFIFNAHKASNDPGVGFRSGSIELDEEVAWSEDFRDKLAGTGIEIVNCIGRPILENLYWIWKSKYFVAPLGGGLAKYRWATNIPGFVMCSQVNITRCTLTRAYDDPSQMDEPFSRLDYTVTDDIVDIPLDPPRVEPAPLHGIPHPENFQIVDPAGLSERICERIAYLSKSNPVG